MTLAATLSLASLYDLLPIAPDGLKFGLDFMQQRALTGGGDRQVSDRAPAMLSLDLTTIPMEHAEAEAIMALVNSRAGGLKAFLATNPRLPYPSTDPTGSTFGAATPTVGTITDRLHVAFATFPNSYVIPVGTWFQIIYETSKYYVGQFCEARTSHVSTGAVASVEIYPPLPAGISTGAAVTVKKPAGKFKPIGGTAFISTYGALHSVVTLSAEQSYSAD